MFLIWISDLIDSMGYLPQGAREIQESVIVGYMQRPKYWRHVQSRAGFNLSL